MVVSVFFGKPKRNPAFLFIALIICEQDIAKLFQGEALFLKNKALYGTD